MPQAKYSHEAKLKVVRGFLEDGMTHKDSAAQIGANKSDSQKWVYLYQEHGESGLVSSNEQYSGQARASVIEYMYANSMSVRKTAAKFGITSPATVQRWKAIYDREGREALLKENRGRKLGTKMPKGTRRPKRATTLISKEAEKALIAENQRLKMENAYLKKLNALVQERIRRENGKK